MKRSIVCLPIILPLCLLILLQAGKSKPVMAGSADNPLLPAYSPDELLIKFRNGVGPSAIRDSLTEVQGTVLGYLGNEISPAQMVFEDRAQRSFVGDPDLFLIRIPEIADMNLVISRLRANAEIEYIERNLYFHNCSIDDPLYADQWALDKIQAPEAWDLSTGSSDIIVAIIDSGIQNDHPDLQDHLWHNPGETENGEDDDNNSYPDDLHGWHWGYSADDNSTENWNGDSHATQIAGIIGASWNTIGIRGINENVKIMSLNVQGYRAEVELSDIIRAIDYANDNGAAIISFSMASPEYDSQALESAIIRARERGLLFVCGIGNFESGYTGWYDVDDQESHHMYPGCFPEDNIISVLATDSSDDLGSYSMFGEYSVDVGAPGEMIKSTILGSSYNWASGTSFAAPHVAGVAALALGKCPALPYNVLKSRIMDLGDVLSSLEGKCVSERRLNAYNVVYDPNNPSSPSAPSNLSATPSAWDTIELTWSDNSNNEIGFEIQRYNDEKPVYMRLVSTGTNVHTFRDEHADTWNEELNSGVVHTYRVRAGNLGGLSGFSSTASAQIPHTTPAAPSDLSAPTPVIRYVEFELTWADNANNEQTFSLQRKAPGGNWTEIRQLPANSTSYTDCLTQIGTFYYRIKAQNPLGSSSYSGQVAVVVEDW